MIRKFIVSLFLVFGSTFSYADSPITSTSFYSSYNEIPQIYKAEKEGILSFESASFLSSPLNTVDKKMALGTKVKL